MRKIAVILVIFVLSISGFGALAINAENKNQPDIQNFSNGDELDQYQTELSENKYALIGQIPIPENPIYIQVAQSFIPTKDILTRVELYIGKNSTTTYPYFVAIRDNLTEEDLVLISVSSEQILTEDFSWIEFNFDDIAIIAGETYFVVSYTENTTDNFYGIGANNNSESYPFGHAWFSYDGGDSWSNESDESSSCSIEVSNKQSREPGFDRIIQWDLCFKTYGRDNNAPGEVDVDGPASGVPNIEYNYVLTATDPDGDDIKYFVDWGDGDSEWTDLVASETSVTVSHSWAEVGTYTVVVKAQDEFGADGPESSYDIPIPRNKATYNSFFLQFLERFLLIKQLFSLYFS